MLPLSETVPSFSSSRILIFCVNKFTKYKYADLRKKMSAFQIKEAEGSWEKMMRLEK